MYSILVFDLQSVLLFFFNLLRIYLLIGMFYNIVYFAHVNHSLRPRQNVTSSDVFPDIPMDQMFFPGLQLCFTCHAIVESLGMCGEGPEVRKSALPGESGKASESDMAA